MKRRSFFNFILIIVLVIGAIIMGVTSLQPAAGAEVVSLTRDGLVINEVMAKNSSAVPAEDGGFYDWVELYNGGALPVPLSGLSLSDKDTEPGRFPLPNITLQPGEYAIIWCSGKNLQGPPMHAGFRISAGETISLFNADQDVIDSVTIETAQSNVSYARQMGGGFIETNEYSPGYPNTAEGHQEYLSRFQQLGSSSLKLNEVMSANKNTIKDLDGEYSDWIELVNTGSAAVDLTGAALSDDESEPRKWVFTGGVVQPGETFLIFASGKDLKDETPPHASFRLSASGETVILYDAAGMVIDRVDAPELKDDEAYALNPSTGAWEKTAESTPNLPNDESGRRESARRIIEGNEGLYISQVVSGNGGSLAVGSDTPDWVEIVNRTGASIDLAGYGLTNRMGRPHRWQFPDGAAIADGERMVVALDGRDAYDGGYYHASFNLSLSGGDWVAVSDAQGKLLDRIALPALRQDIAIGRDEALTGLFYFDNPTPGAPNVNPRQRLAPKPEFETAGGMVSPGTAARVKPVEGYTLRYTTDCSEPTASSPVFPGEIPVNGTTVLRVGAFSDDAIPSVTTSATFIVGENHTVPVVALVTEPGNLFSESSGIWANGPGYKEEFPHGSRGSGANFWMDWEKPVHVEVYGIGGVEISQNAGIKNNGQYSRALAQKSVTIYARSKYEKDTFDGKLFENRDYGEYRAFVLRSTAQDSDRARMRDAMLTSLAEDSGVMHQDTRVVVVYVNGEFWGHYNMRERVNKNSVAQWEGIDLSNTAVIDKIDIIKGNSRALNGVNTGYREIIDFVKEKSLTNEENLKWVTDRVDVQNYFDYQAMEIIVGNSDNGNIKFYNTNTPGSKWKWILYDVDWAYNTNESVGVKWNTFDGYLDPRGTGVGDQFENVLFRKLLENPQMKQLFLERFAYHLNNTYSAERVNARIDEYYEVMKPEMEKHYQKWPKDGSVESWEKHINRLRTYANERPGYIKQHCKDYFNLSESQMRELFGG